MNPKLLDFYERELNRLRIDGSELARTITGAETLDRAYEDRDPFVVQLLQSFAYTLARIGLEAEAERDRLPGTVLQTLYPAALRPVPARTIVQFGLMAGGDVPAEGRLVPAHTTLTVADAPQVFFRTANECVIPPVALTGVQLLPPGEADRSRHRLTLFLKAAKPELRLESMQLRLPRRLDVSSMRRDDAAAFGLRIFLGGADSPLSLRLFQAVTRAPVRANVVWPGGGQGSLVEDAVRLVGFDAADSMLPIDPRQSEAGRLVSEYAVFRDKFLFVDVVGLAPTRFRGAGSQVNLELMLDPESAALLEGFSLAQAVRLGCVPAVNLERCELPARPLHRAQHEFELDPDPHERSKLREVFAVESVRATFEGQTEVEYVEMYAPVPPGTADPAGSREDRITPRKRGYWYARRSPAEAAEAAPDTDTGEYDPLDPTGPNRSARGHDVRLSLAEFDARRVVQAGRTLRVGATCFLRDIEPAARKQLLLRGDAGEATSVSRLLGPAWPEAGGDLALLLIEFLSCGAGLLRGGRDSAATLSDFLMLHGRLFPGSGATAQLLHEAFVRGVETLPVATGLAGGIARGLSVRVKVDPRGASRQEVYLLARVLDHALSAFCSAGGFTQLTVIVEDGLSSEVLAQCPPRLGKIAIV